MGLLKWQRMLGLQLGPQHGQVAGRVAGAVLAFVAGVVLFVYHDQLQAGQGREHAHARAQHNAGVPGVRSQPAGQALRRRHAAVHGYHGVCPVQGGKARGKALLQLRREINLGHHYQYLGAGRGLQHLLGAAQVHLGFAAAGGTKQQGGQRRCAGRSGGKKLGDDLGLLHA